MAPQYISEEYESMIDAVLTYCDEEVSLNSLRAQLNEVFSLNIKSFDLNLRTLVDKKLEAFKNVTEKPKVKDISTDKVMTDNRRYINVIKQTLKEAELKKEGITVTKVQKPKLKLKVTNSKKSMIHIKMTVTPELQAVIGTHYQSRTEIVRNLWKYIKEHNLQNPDDKRQIISDAMLEPVLGKTSDIFMMHRALKHHILGPAPIEAEVIRTEQESTPSLASESSEQEHADSTDTSDSVYYST